MRCSTGSTSGAAVLADDPTLLDECLGSLLRMLHGRLTGDVVLGGVDVVADAIGPLAPHGAALLGDAVGRARGSAPQPRQSDDRHR